MTATGFDADPTLAGMITHARHFEPLDFLASELKGDSSP